MNAVSRYLCACAFLCGSFLLVSPTLHAAPVCLEPGGIGGTGAVATGALAGLVRRPITAESAALGCELIMAE